MSDNRDVIQARLLANIDDKYDKTEGSFFYDVEKPVSIELESAYTIIEGLLDKRFADTSTGKDLDRVVKEVGLYRKLTQQAFDSVIITGMVGADINAGDLVASDNVSFAFTETTVIPASGTIVVGVICTTYGAIGNVPAGAIKYFPKTLAGLQTVTNTNAYTNGYDEESDASLRARYYVKVQTPGTSGNVYDYLNWSLSVVGTGNARIVPLWDVNNGRNGAGSVQVILINSNMVHISC
jgi:uncharacterized phage protein gp47/JayE